MFSGDLREAIRSVHVSYPVPFIATLLVVSSLALVGLATLFTAGERLLVLGLACAAFVVALGVVLKAVFFTPSLLRSERYVFLDKMMAITGDHTMDAATRERLQARMIASWDEPHSRKSAAPMRRDETRDGSS